MANEKDAARKAAIAANNRAWALIEKADRSPAEAAEMIGAAHASLADWTIAGGPVEIQRGNWLIARSYLAAGIPAAALEYAERTWQLTEQHRAMLADFDLAFAEEIAARAFALAGDAAQAKIHYAEARRLGEAITDDGDRAEFFRQLAIGPWFGADG